MPMRDELSEKELRVCANGELVKDPFGRWRRHSQEWLCHKKLG
jgi:hypothetical protein